MNKSFDRVNANGCTYTPAEADAVVSKWRQIAKGLVDRDLRGIQLDLTGKINKSESVPDEFLNSKHVAYRVAGVITEEIMRRRNKLQQTNNEQMRSAYEQRKAGR